MSAAVWQKWNQHWSVSLSLELCLSYQHTKQASCASTDACTLGQTYSHIKLSKTFMTRASIYWQQNTKCLIITTFTTIYEEWRKPKTVCCKIYSLQYCLLTDLEKSTASYFEGLQQVQENFFITNINWQNWKVNLHVMQLNEHIS